MDFPGGPSIAIMIWVTRDFWGLMWLQPTYFQITDFPNGFDFRSRDLQLTIFKHGFPVTISAVRFYFKWFRSHTQISVLHDFQITRFQFIYFRKSLIPPVNCWFKYVIINADLNYDQTMIFQTRIVNGLISWTLH